MINTSLYKSPIGISGVLTPDNLQIWLTHKEYITNQLPYYTLVYITTKGHLLPVLRPYRHKDRVKFIKEELLGYFHNPLEYHTEEEINQVRSILNNSLVRKDAIRPIRNHLGITEKKARALIAKILNPNEYNPFVYGIETYYRGFNFYSQNIWETGILPPLRRPRFILINQV